MIGAKAGTDAVDHSTERTAIVPVCVEVGDEIFGHDSRNPTHHGLLGGETTATALDLVLANESPDEAENQLQVSTVDVFRT